MMFSALAQMKTLSEMSLKAFAHNEKVKKRNKNQLEVENKRLKQALKLQEERHRTERLKIAYKAIKATTTKKNKAKFNRWTIRISKADKAFSLAIRLRANCQCEHCGQQFSVDNLKDLHCAHYYSRENPNVRFSPLNAFALCKGCHFNFDRSKKAKFSQFVRETLSDTDYFKLSSLANAPKTTLNAQQETKLTAYYNLVARQLKMLRLNGEQDYFEFEAYSPNHE